jgi:hypothetical protein
MTETKERTKASKIEALEEELREVEENIESMERELAECEQPIVWGEVDAGELEAKERRRAILPRLITAARIRRAELRIQHEREAAEPLQAQQEAAYNKMRRAEDRERKAHEDLMAARSEWSGVHTRLEKIARRIKDAEREIEALANAPREGR